MASFDRSLLGADPPAHTRFRRIVEGVFSPQRIAGFEGRIRDNARRHIAVMKDRGQCELLQDLAYPLPASVIMELLGADPERATDLKRWCAAVMAKAAGAESPVEQAQITESVRAFRSFVEGLIAQCLRGQTKSLLAELLSTGAMTPQEAASFARLLFLAGIETTAHWIGNALLALLRDPQQAQATRENARLVVPLLEETLGRDPPVRLLYRHVMRDVELSGTRVPAGARVAALLASWRRDEEESGRPDRVAPPHRPPRHLGFGIGPHYCLGAQLASLEARIVIEELLSSTPNLRVAQPLDTIQFVDSFQMRGPVRLALAWDR